MQFAKSNKSSGGLHKRAYKLDNQRLELYSLKVLFRQCLYSSSIVLHIKSSQWFSFKQELNKLNILY